MLTALILLLIRRYKNRRAHRLFPSIRFIPYIIPVLVILVSSAFCTAQQINYLYSVSLNGKPAGQLNVVRQASSDSVVIDINSLVSTRMIFLFRVISIEKAIFMNGRLIYSLSSRQVNNGRKSEIVTRDMGSGYRTQKEGKVKQLNRSCIYHNMSSLYLSEPVNFTEVYSDNFQEFLVIALVEPHHYRIKLPDGNYNEYFYGDGVCRKIKVYQSLFTAQIDLKSINHL